MKGKYTSRRPLVLVEVLVALLVLGTLTGIVVKNLHGGLEEARYQRSLRDAASIATALEMYLISEPRETPQSALKNWAEIARTRPQLGALKSLRDGWGKRFECFAPKAIPENFAAQFDQQDQTITDNFAVVSGGMNDYLKKHPRRVARSPKNARG